MAPQGRKPSPGQTAAQRAHAEAERDRYRSLPKGKRAEIVKTRDRDAQAAADRRRHERDRPTRLQKQKAVRTKQARTGSQDQQRKARATALVAKSTGRIKPPATCQHPGCTAKPTTMHHSDYSKPLNVRHLCAKHHGEADRGTTASKRGKYA